jgi:hypothetical protein
MTDDPCRASKKKKYATRAEADAAIAGLAQIRRNARSLSSYECPYCNYWHMTSKPKPDPSTSRPQYLKHPRSRKAR